MNVCSAFYIILGDDYNSYSNALETLECDNLNDRRVKLCGNFAPKSVKNQRYSSWFSVKTGSTMIQNEFNPVMTRTDMPNRPAED